MKTRAPRVHLPVASSPVSLPPPSVVRRSRAELRVRPFLTHTLALRSHKPPTTGK